jgi:hypothetical protein
LLPPIRAALRNEFIAMLLDVAGPAQRFEIRRLIMRPAISSALSVFVMDHK